MTKSYFKRKSQKEEEFISMKKITEIFDYETVCDISIGSDDDTSGIQLLTRDGSKIDVTQEIFELVAVYLRTNPFVDSVLCMNNEVSVALFEEDGLDG